MLKCHIWGPCQRLHFIQWYRRNIYFTTIALTHPGNMKIIILMLSLNKNLLIVVCNDFAASELICISGLVVEYIVAIDVTRARFPADAFVLCLLPKPTFFSDVHKCPRYSDVLISVTNIQQL